MNLVIYHSILFNSVVKTIDSITCYSDLLYREANGSAIKVKFMENQVRFVTEPSRVTATGANMKAAKNPRGTPFW